MAQTLVPLRGLYTGMSAEEKWHQTENSIRTYRSYLIRAIYFVSILCVHQAILYD